jgi:cupin fold WbuC family metalloprotein
MSTRYNRTNTDPLALIPFDDALLDEAVRQARSSPRKRVIVRFHEHEEGLQRMLNAVEPESYVRPHRHVAVYKPEAFVALRGSLLVIRFADDGAPLEGIVVSPDGPVKGVDIPQRAWHCFIALKSGTVIFEVSQGPYDPTTAKEYAPWSPPEEDVEAGQEFIARMRAYFEPLLPEVSALDQIEAEEDEIC